MVYKTNFVVVVKSNKKVLREKDNFITLPFGSEYSLLLKNLNSRRASVNISIDGQDVLNNSSLVIEPNNETELEGFLDGNVAKNKFKFIKKTKEIQEHRGDKIDDGIIRVEFAFEKKPVITNRIIYENYYYHNYPWYDFRNYTFTANESGKVGDVQTFHSSCNSEVRGCSAIPNENSNIVFDDCSPKEDEGITVKGSEINQNFHNTYIGELDQSEVIILQLKGIKNSGEEVSKPITVKTKLTCPTCGKKSSSKAKFCSNCGTFLE